MYPSQVVKMNSPMVGCKALRPVLIETAERMLHVKKGIQQNRKQPGIKVSIDLLAHDVKMCFQTDSCTTELCSHYSLESL